MYTFLCADESLFLLPFNQTLILSTNFRRKYSDIKFLKISSSEKPVLPYGQTDIKKVLVASDNFVNALEKKLTTDSLLVTQRSFVDKYQHFGETCHQTSGEKSENYSILKKMSTDPSKPLIAVQERNIFVFAENRTIISLFSLT